MEYFLALKLDKPIYRLLADVNTHFDVGSLEPESAELQQIQDVYRADVIRDRDWRPFASADQLRAELAELRFPWESPQSDHKPRNLPLTSIGSLFKGRERFLLELHKRLGMSDRRTITGARCVAVHGLGGVGKTRAAVEYAVRYGDEYTALLFVSAPTPDELQTNLANLVRVLDIRAEGLQIDEQLATVVDWLNTRRGWLLIVDNVDTEEAAHGTQRMLTQLQSGHVLITSRITNWSAGVEPMELDVLAPADADAFLLDRTRHRRRASDDAMKAAAIARELDGLALALKQAGAYIDKLRLSFADYQKRWNEKRPDVLRWHDLRLMQYPASVAITWETTFDQLTESEQRLLEVLAWLAPEPIPLSLCDTEPLVNAIRDPREALSGLAAYSLARFDASGEAILVHRLVQEITRGRIPDAERRDATLQLAVNAVTGFAPPEPEDVRTWAVWTPLAVHAEAVAAFADAVGLPEATTRLMSQLGRFWEARGRFEAAEPLYRRALAIDEASYGPDHPWVATGLNNLAGLLHSTNRLAEAEPLYRRALAINEASYGPDHPTVAKGLNNLAGLLKATNRLAEAEPLYRRALAINEASYGPDHPTVAIRLNNLALLLQAANRLAEAEPLYRRALAINEASYGPDHPTVATGLNNLAGLLQATNRLAEAEPLYRRALAIDEASYGPDHPTVATGLNNLALLLKSTNRLADAEPLYRRALAINEASYGPGHPTVATGLNNLAGLLEAINRIAEAEPLYRRALAIDEASYGPDHPTVAIRLNNLALLLAATNRFAEAEPLYRRALAINERSYGPEHPMVATGLNNLGELLRTTNRLAEAEPLYRRALAIDEASYGPDHPTVAIRLNNLAWLLQTSNRLAEAEPLCVRAAKIFVNFRLRSGHQHPHFRMVQSNYAHILEASGRTPDQVERELNALGCPAS